MWYVLLNDEQLGPMTQREVQELLQQGVMGPTTLVWQEGLTEWTEVSTRAEFQVDLDDDVIEDSIADDSEANTLIVNPADHALAAAFDQMLRDESLPGAELEGRPTDAAAGEDASDQLPPTLMLSPEELPIDDQKTSVLTDAEGQVAVADRPTAQDVEGEFNLPSSGPNGLPEPDYADESLENLIRDAEPASLVPVPRELDTPLLPHETKPEAYVPHSDLGRAVASPQSEMQPESTAPRAVKTAHQSSFEPAETTGATERRRSPRLLLIVLTLLLIGGLASVGIFWGGSPTKEATPAPTTLKVKTVKVAPKEALDARDARAISGDAGARDSMVTGQKDQPNAAATSNKAAPTAQPTMGGKAKDTRAKKEEKSKDNTSPVGQKTKVAASNTSAPRTKPSKKARTKSKSASPSNQSGVFTAPKRQKLPLMLGRRQISRVLKKNRSRAQKCVKSVPELQGRTVSVAIQIQRNGKVSRARMATSVARGTEAGACIENALKTYRFPKFRGDPMSITLPLTFR